MFVDDASQTVPLVDPETGEQPQAPGLRGRARRVEIRPCRTGPRRTVTFFSGCPELVVPRQSPATPASPRYPAGFAARDKATSKVAGR